jgi:hypothetical protein
MLDSGRAGALDVETPFDTCAREASMRLAWPSSWEEVAAIQHARKRRAVEQALRAPLLKTRLKSINLDRLDDPEVRAKIPLPTKEELREISTEQFHEQFCVAPRRDVVELARAGWV